MPRVVNEDERRTEISDAVWKIAAEQGIPAVTFRRVAAELGTSTTVVTRTFRSRDYMLDEIFQMRVQQWITEMRANADGPDTAGHRLRDTLLVCCPVTQSDLRDARVWLATIGPPNPRPTWLARFGEFNRTFYDLVTRLLKELGAHPSLLHPLVALVWGVNAAAVEDPVQWPGPRVRWTIDTTLAVLGLGEPVATVSVRYIVNDVEAAITFYCENLGFTEVMHPAPAFAMLSRGDLRLVLSAPGGGPGGGQVMPDGTSPQPGGWNRFSIEVTDLASTVEKLGRSGVRFRNDIVTGVGGKQIIAEDPSGNPVELFEPILPEARLQAARH